jgi:hypothetical protein
MNLQENLVRLVGVATCLIGAFLMAFGEPIIGLEHTGIATVVGITGIGLISAGNKIVIMRKKEGHKNV